MIQILILLGFAGAALGAEPVSPHGAKDSCAACHDPVEAGTPAAAIPFARGSADGACESCHEERHHQVGITPKRVHVPPQMLLLDGKLACISCHDEPSCDGSVVSEADPLFFRGGPYRSLGELCVGCHPASGQDRFNPHEAMKTGETGVCEYCHVEVPHTAATTKLRVSGPNTCLGCHRRDEHAGAADHLVTAPQWALDGATRARLPLDEAGAIVCLTCHDPHPGATAFRDAAHQQGGPLLPERWVAEVLAPATEEPAPVEPDYLRLPLGDGELCTACHDANWARQARKEAK